MQENGETVKPAATVYKSAREEATHIIYVYAAVLSHGCLGITDGIGLPQMRQQTLCLYSLDCGTFLWYDVMAAVLKLWH